MASRAELLARLQTDLKEDYAHDVRLANQSVIKGSGSPGFMGDRLFSDAVKYGAVFQNIDAAMPLFEASRLAFDLALKARPKTKTKPRPDTTVYDKLHERFSWSFGHFASTEIAARREEPADTTMFRVGLSALAMTFTESVLDEARRNPDAFETRALPLTTSIFSRSRPPRVSGTSPSNRWPAEGFSRCLSRRHSSRCASRWWP